MGSKGVWQQPKWSQKNQFDLVIRACRWCDGWRPKRTSVERSNLITFDVGGTSADIGLIVKNTYSEATARDTWIGGYPVMAR
ncbi:MAG: hypothetical protein CM1200mP41_37510 [Gammaproteobacteria bacterium]|nr:MAG: hypothetical protein CM1200mP41_37510 [Gammaproteobacteria bacterium]